MSENDIVRRHLFRCQIAIVVAMILVITSMVLRHMDAKQKSQSSPYCSWEATREGD